MSNRFPGVPYPLIKDAKGYFRKQGGTAQIKADLLQLLLTNPGERVMLPDFGTDLRGLIFEMNDVILQTRAKNLIIDSIAKWEPRITITDIQVLTSFDTELNNEDDRSEVDNILFIQITFVDPNNIQQIEQLTLEVPLSL